jgi:hypothetical protein
MITSQATNGDLVTWKLAATELMELTKSIVAISYLLAGQGWN